MRKLIWRNLLRNKVRTLLTVLSVAIALFLLTLLGGVYRALTAVGSENSAELLVARNAISLTFQLPEAYGQRLRSIEGVEEIVGTTWFQGVYKDTRPENMFPRFAADETLFEVYQEIEISDEHLQAWLAERDAFVAGRALAEKQGWEIGDRIQIQGDIYPVNLDLVLRGLFEWPGEEFQENLIYFHRRYLEEATGNPGIVGTYWMRLSSEDVAPQVIQTSEAMFENSAAQVRTETGEAFAASFTEMLGNVQFLFGAIGLGIVISILFITANTMAMAARERTTETAVLRTLGFQRPAVLGMVLGEALLVGGLGALLGVLGGSLALQGLGEAMQQFAPTFAAVRATPGILAGALGLGLVIGFASGIIPAVAQARASIVDGLRSVG
ncbi:MAG: ABC transporter permease [Acidobacteria bacterium]|nr:MAG: ABC transporter permease [Acidobacteriota bacterium]